MAFDCQLKIWVKKYYALNLLRVNIKHFLSISFFLTAFICKAQKDMPLNGLFWKEDTLIEIKTFQDLNSIRVFKKLNGSDTIIYLDYYFKSRTLRNTGVFQNGMCKGVWKFYTKKGLLEKKVDYDSCIKTLYLVKNEPYDDVFLDIKRRSDSLLIAKFGSTFFNKYIIMNPNRTYYYGSGVAGSWFETPDYEPIKFRMVYDIKLSDENRFAIIIFDIDREGNFISKDTISNFSNIKKDIIITTKMADSIALNNGLSISEQPFKYNLILSKDSIDSKLEFQVMGQPFEKKQVNNITTEFFTEIFIDPFTGQFIKKQIKKSCTIACP